MLLDAKMWTFLINYKTAPIVLSNNANYDQELNRLLKICSSEGQSYATKTLYIWAVVVAQLVELLLLTPEICSSNPVISKILFPINCIKKQFWKNEIKEKEAGNGPLKTLIMGSCSTDLYGSNYWASLWGNSKDIVWTTRNANCCSLMFFRSR